MPRKTAVSSPPPDSLSRPDLTLPILGHSGQEADFIDALMSGRMHHAWLIHGPQGVGKAKFAHHASAFLMASQARLDGLGLMVDPKDPQARLLDQGAHPDAAWLDRATGQDGKKLPRTIPVAQVRGLLHQLDSTPAYGGWRTIVIDSLDALNREGANALLKPLEEPPRQTVIFLVAHSLGAVLPTIRSRCRHLQFGPLDAASMQQLVGQLAPPDLDPVSVRLAVELANGRAGLFASLAVNDHVLPIYRHFCEVALVPSHSQSMVSERLDLAATVNQLGDEQKSLVLGLIEDWLSRRLRDAPEPLPVANPASPLDATARNMLADLWSDHTARINLRRAINLDITQSMMALFDGLDAVYSGRMPA
jgi:hypothetical protein